MLHRAPRHPLLSSVSALATTIGAAGAVLAAVAVTSPSDAALADTGVGTSASGLTALVGPRQVDAADSLAAKGTAQQRRAALVRVDLRADLTAAAARQKAAADRRAKAQRVSRAKARAALNSSDPRTAARSLVAARGWGSSQFSCLDSLWSKESGWKHTANNPSSRAFGIPQALPGSKMASAGSDWRTNPVTQIKWGLGYIESRYSSPCAAWRHSQSNNWY